MRYLGEGVDWGVYLLGQAWVLLMQLSAQYFNEYFGIIQTPSLPRKPEESASAPFSGESGALGPGRLPPAIALWGGISCLAVTASLSALLFRSLGQSYAAYLVMFLMFLGACLYSLPPLRLSSSGYGELVITVLVANLVPAFAFLLQTGELHRLVAMSTFPLTALHLAMLLALEFPSYATDLKRERQTLLVRLGWQQGMVWHNGLLLGGFGILGLAVLLGLPAQIGLPAFFVLPVALFQVWMMNRIADGSRPNWKLLSLTAMATFGLAAYLLTFTFWVR